MTSVIRPKKYLNDLNYLVQIMGRRRIVLKIVCIGDGAVGKTSIVKRYLSGDFRHDYVMTLGLDLFTKPEKIRFKGSEIEVVWQIWDLSGQQYWRDVISSFYKGANGAILVFDVTNNLSYENTIEWALEFYRHAGQQPIVLVGNKIDLRDKIYDSLKSNEGARRAYELSRLMGIKIPYIETSALENINIDVVFNTLKKLIFENAITKLLNETESEK